MKLGKIGSARALARLLGDIRTHHLVAGDYRIGLMDLDRSYQRPNVCGRVALQLLVGKVHEALGGEPLVLIKDINGQYLADVRTQYTKTPGRPLMPRFGATRIPCCPR